MEESGVPMDWLTMNALSQRAKKAMFYSPELVNFAIWPVNSVLWLPVWQVKFFGEFKLQKNSDQSCSSKEYFCGLVEMEAVKLTFFAPCFLFVN